MPRIGPPFFRPGAPFLARSPSIGGPAVQLAAAVAASEGIALEPAADPDEFIRVLGRLTPAQRQALQRALFGAAVFLASHLHGQVGLVFDLIDGLLTLIAVLDAIDKKK